MRYVGTDGEAVITPLEIAILDELVSELQDRYEGAPDSRTLWMAKYIAAINHMLWPMRRESNKA